MMRKWSLGLLLLLVVSVPFLLLSTGSGRADDRDRERERAKGPVQFLKAFPVPVSAVNGTSGAMYSFDISFVDPATGTYYLADRSNKSVDVLKENTGVVTQIFPNNGHAPFAGFVPCSPALGANDCAGPNGVVAAFPWLFVTDANSRVLTFDLRTSPPTTVSEVNALPAEKTRADELAYDPKDGLLLVINNASEPPVGTLVKVDKANGHLSVVKNIFFDTKPGHSGVGSRNRQVLSLHPANRADALARRGLAHLDDRDSGGDLSGGVLLAGRPGPRSQARFACRLQYGLRHGGQSMDRECGPRHEFREAQVCDPGRQNGQHR
jgi:hypothetical protein